MSAWGAKADMRLGTHPVRLFTSSRSQDAGHCSAALIFAMNGNQTFAEPTALDLANR
jgi:hypothetical protein